MKKRNLLFAIALLLSGFSAFSQGPTLTFANSGVVPGDVYTAYNADTSAQPGTSGDNQTWNFATLSINPVATSLPYVAPSATPYPSAFPAATAATNKGEPYTYYKVNSSEFSILGYHVLTPSNDTIKYTDPQKLFNYPFSFQNTFTDNFLSAVFVQGINTVRKGVSTTTADGLGTLILPSGSYSNILRVKIIQDYVDSNLYTKFYTHIETYSWYDGSHKNPVFKIEKKTSTMGGNYKNVLVSSDVYVGIDNAEKNNQQLSVFPNPATDNITIMLDPKEQSLLQIAVFDMQGKMIKDFGGPGLLCGNNQLALDVADIPGGIYFVNIKTNSGCCNKKIVLY